MLSPFSFLLPEKYLIWFAEGFLTTCTLSITAIILSTLLALMLISFRLSHYKWLRLLAICYGILFRNTPLLIQLSFWYFGVGQYLPASLKNWLFNLPQTGWRSFLFPSFEYLAGLVGLMFYSAAYLAENLRTGVLSVEPSHCQAGSALGLTYRQVRKNIIMPKAIKAALPAVIAEYMNVIKNASLAMAIGVVDISYVSRQVETETLQSFQSVAVSTLLYIHYFYNGSPFLENKI